MVLTLLRTKFFIGDVVMAIAEALGILGMKNTAAIKSIETVIGGISGIFSFKSTIEALLGFAGLLGGGPFDEIKRKLDDIERAIINLNNVVIGATGVAIEINKMIEIANQVAPVITAADLATDYIADQSVENKERLEYILIDAQTAINSLLIEPMNNGYFRRLYNQELVYQMWDDLYLQPPNITSDQVWNYQYVLPCVLRAIVLYLTASGVSEPNIEKYRRRYSGELHIWAESLQQIHDEIASQITDIREPNRHELCPRQQVYASPVNSDGTIIGGASETGPNILIPYETFFCDEHGHLTGNKWYNRGRIYGAVEAYSAIALEKTWPAIECPRTGVQHRPFESDTLGSGTYKVVNPFPPPEQFYQDFYPKHAIATQKAMKHLYLSLGLLSMWRIIGEIRAIAGLDPILPHPMSFWSLRKIDNVVSFAKFGRPSTASVGNRISLRAIADTLGVTPPFSLRNSILAQN